MCSKIINSWSLMFEVKQALYSSHSCDKKVFDVPFHSNCIIAMTNLHHTDFHSKIQHKCHLQQVRDFSVRPAPGCSSYASVRKELIFSLFSKSLWRDMREVDREGEQRQGVELDSYSALAVRSVLCAPPQRGGRENKERTAHREGRCFCFCFGPFLELILLIQIHWPVFSALSGISFTVINYHINSPTHIWRDVQETGRELTLSYCPHFSTQTVWGKMFVLNSVWIARKWLYRDRYGDRYGTVCNTKWLMYIIAQYNDTKIHYSPRMPVIMCHPPLKSLNILFSGGRIQTGIDQQHNQKHIQSFQQNENKVIFFLSKMANNYCL